MPEGAVYVGRPTKWGNPYRLDTYRFARADGTPYNNDEAAREMAMRDFWMWLQVTEQGQGMLVEAQRELRGKTLVCWCPLNKACHADVLLELANR